MFGCVQNPPPAFRVNDAMQVFVDRPHGHVGGDVLGCARRKFQLLRSNLVFADLWEAQGFSMWKQANINVLMQKF